MIYARFRTFTGSFRPQVGQQGKSAGSIWFRSGPKRA
jgi:hypothetical protein